jgi:hypothetical protein
MALTFSAGSLTLANWGFGVGDIAVFAGAGRNVGNWLMAQTRDRNLVDFLKLDIDSIIIRRGLIDVVELHKRWDHKITLLQNGSPMVVAHPGGDHLPVVDNMDKFTWLMTLVIAALDAAIGPAHLHVVVSDLLSQIFKDTPDGMEYLLREIPKHIQGWRSSAVIRGILKKSDLLWTTLAQHGEHWPGCIPVTAFGEIVRLLVWLSTERSPRFVTASTDVFCFAVVLYEIGLQQIAPVKISQSDYTPDLDEGVACVALDTRWSGSVSNKNSSVDDPRTKRNGMSIPLNHMEECMSLWPADRNFAARLRTLFENGMFAVRDDKIEIDASDVQDWNFEYFVAKDTQAQRQANRRLDTLEYRVIDTFLPVISDRVSQHIQNLVGGWDKHTRNGMETYLSKDGDAPQLHLQEAAQAELQAFLLGFYYALLRPIVDCSRLSVQEVYGAWGYTTSRFLLAIRRMKCHAKTRPSPLRSPRVDGKEHCQFFKREAVLYLVAFLFAGVEPNSGVVSPGHVRNMSITSATSTIGILSKISVLPRIMLGSNLERRHAAQLCLLDCDTSFIPCNTSGWVQEGMSSHLILDDVDSESGSNLSGGELLRRLWSDNTSDFTPHLEPDWDNDVQCSMLVYRHRGRIVYSMPFSSILHALAQDRRTHHSPTSADRNQPEPEALRRLIGQQSNMWASWIDTAFPSQAPSNTAMVLASPQDFHGGTILWNRARDGSAVVFASLIGMPNAVLCIMAMYAQQARFLNLVDAVVVVSSEEEMSEALKAGKQYIILV